MTCSPLAVQPTHSSFRPRGAAWFPGHLGRVVAAAPRLHTHRVSEGDKEGKALRTHMGPKGSSGHAGGQYTMEIEAAECSRRGCDASSTEQRPILSKLPRFLHVGS